MCLQHLMLDHSTLGSYHFLFLSQNVLAYLSVLLLLIRRSIDLLPFHLRKYWYMTCIFSGLLAVSVEHRRRLLGLVTLLLFFLCLSLVNVFIDLVLLVFVRVTEV